MSARLVVAITANCCGLVCLSAAAANGSVRIPSSRRGQSTLFLAANQALRHCLVANFTATSPRLALVLRSCSHEF